LLILIILASFAEVVSLGAVVPFLGVLTNPERVFSLPALQPLIHALGFTEPKQLLLPVCLAFVFAAIFSNAIRLVLVWAQMGDTTKVHSTPAGEGHFRVLKSTKNEIFVKHVGGRV
jgi:ATP-binding cassette, subfamily B, bacterial PglK